MAVFPKNLGELVDYVYKVVAELNTVKEETQLPVMGNDEALKEDKLDS